MSVIRRRVEDTRIASPRCRPALRSSHPLSAVAVVCLFVGAASPELARVWLFFVDGPGGFCERHGKSYLTRRRRGGEGGGGGSLTGGAVRAAYRWA